MSDAFIPSWPIADPVGDRDRAELERHRSALPDALLREGSELAEVVVARGHLVPGRGDSDLRLAEVVLGEADSAEHRAGGRAVGTLGDLPAARTIVLAGHWVPFVGACEDAGLQPNKEDVSRSCR